MTTPAAIKALRNKNHLTQTQAAALVHVTLRVWQSWEGGEHAMHAGLWELFQLKVKSK